MKYLLKSSFKSFFQYKFAIILLSIIVFITSAAFTMFQSTSNAFDQSYNNVVTQGVLHDFTIKEKYPDAGDIYLDDPKKGREESITKDVQDLSADNVLADPQGHVYIVGTITHSSASAAVYVDINDITSSATKLDVKVVSEFKYGTFWGFGDGFEKFDPNSQHNKEEVIKMLADPSHHGSAGSNKRLAIQDATFDIKTSSLKVVNGSEHQNFSVSFPSLLTALVGHKDKSIKKVTGDYNHYSYQISPTSSTLVKDAFNGLSSSDWGTIAGIPSNDFIVEKSFEGASDEFDHSITSNFIPLNYKKVSDALKQMLFNKVNSEQSNVMKHTVLDKYVKDGMISYKDVKSLYVTSDKNAFRFVNEKEHNPTVDKLKLFSGFGLPEQEDPAIMKARLKAMDSEVNDQNTVDKGYSMISNWQETGSIFFVKYSIPRVASVFDTSSFAAVVSPSYASKNGIKAMTRTEYDAATKLLKAVLDDKDHSFEDVEAVLASYKENVIWAQSTPYLVTGIGITPDFSYPIVDASNPIPDSSNQAIIYTNGNGYNRIQDAFRGNTTENYLAVKVNKGNKEAVMKKINDELEVMMNWPSGIHPARDVNDTDEKVILAPQRITFLQTIKKTVSTISWVTILLMILFTAFIVGLVVKKKIASRTKQLAILMANGYSKLQIATSMMVIGLIVGGISTILGYAIGHVLQYAFIGIFKDYWTLPIWETQFSWLSLVMTVIVPILGISALAFLISLWQLRGNLISKLNGSSSKTKGAFSNALVKGASFVGIKTKISVSIFATNMSKMVMALVAFSMTIIVGSLMFNTFGKFDYALQQSENKVDYDFQVDLSSPTSESGEYGKLSLDNMFVDKHNSHIELKDIYIPIEGQTGSGTSVDDLLYVTSDGNHLDHPFPHVPTQNDEQGEEKDAKYLKNRIQFKSLLNPYLGMGQTGTSPWTVASQMMPENQKNQADKRFNNFINYAKDEAEKSGIKYKFMSSGWYSKLKTQGTLHSKDVSGLTSVPDEYLQFIAYGLQKVIPAYLAGQRDVPLPFFLTYGNVLTDADDEDYTYVKSSNTYTNFNNKIVNEELTVRGIKLNSQSIKLSDDAKTSLANAEQDFKTNGIVDVVVNKYFAKTHGLSEGSQFNSLIENHADVTTGAIGTKYTPTIKYKIVSIQNSFDEGRVFTSQQVARDALGWGSSTTMFNGIFSKHSDELMFQNLPLYSPSGIYAASDTFSDTPISPADKALENFIKTGAFPNKNIKTYDDYIQHYKKSPIVMAYSSVDWATATDFRFHSVLKLSSSLLWMIQSITFFIALLFVALISSMIISDNKKFISTLKVLGYRSGEISRIFITTFLPSLLFAIALTIPIAFGILTAIQAVLIGFGHVLIPLQITGWEIVAATAVLVLGFAIVYWASSRELKTTSVLKAFE